MVQKTRRASPYFFRRVWSPFGHAVGAVRNTAGIAMDAVDSTGKAVATHLNDAVGNLTRRGGKRRSMRRSAKRHAKRNTKRNTKRSTKRNANRKSRRN